ACVPQTTRRLSAEANQWSTFVLGSQVVKLRTNSMLKEDAQLIRPVEGLGTYQYDSVSRRNPHWNQIDLWTSRNNVAQIGDGAAIKTMLDILQGASEGLHERARSLYATYGRHADELLRILEVQA